MYKYLIPFLLWVGGILTASAQLQVELPTSKAELRSLEKDANTGDSRAEFRLGYTYLTGVKGVVEQNSKKGLSWLKKAADHNNADACLILQQLYPNNTESYGDRAFKLYMNDHSGYSYYCLAELLKGNIPQCIKYLAASDRMGYAPAGPALQSLLSKNGGTLSNFVSEQEIIQLTGGDSHQSGKSAANKQNYELAGSRSYGLSDVDDDVPQVDRENDKTIAIIIGNEHYEGMNNVPFANNDAQIFEQYCRLTLGIPKANIYYYADASYGKMRAAVSEMQRRVGYLGRDARVILYYAGHGQCSSTGTDVYLVPTDADQSLPDTWVPVKKLYADLAELPAERVTVFMDACFSGIDRMGQSLTPGARRVAVRETRVTPQGNMIVFSATQSGQTAHPYQEKSHGLFTYFLLKKLQKSKGNVTLGELAEYISQQVIATSNQEGKPSQNPTISSSYMTKGEAWREVKLCP